MAYEKQTWVDGVTPLDAAHLNHMEQGISQLSEEIGNLGGGTGTGGSSGLTTAQVNALDGMFKVCAFIKANISAEYNAFRTAFGIEAATITGISATYSGGSVPAGTALDDLTGIVVTAQYSDGSTATVTGYTLSGEIAEGSNTIAVTYQGKTATFTVTGTAAAQVYTVTNNLTNVTNSNSQTEVTDGFYSATLTVADGYSMQSVVITMGGVDVTDSVYGDGSILITAVTGDIVITAVAGVALAYALPEPLTFAGTGNAAYDTGYAMYADGDKDVSICVDFSVESGPGSNVNIIYSDVTYGYRLWRNGSGIFRVNACQADAVTDIGTPCENARLIWTKAKGEKVHYAYAIKNDAVTEYTGNGYNYMPAASTVTTKIGTTETAFKGTIHDFRVYDQVLSAGQIEAYLRGGTV